MMVKFNNCTINKIKFMIMDEINLSKHCEFPSIWKHEFNTL